MSTLTGQKSDGSPINFNFKLENGLPFKPLIEPEHKYYHTINNDGFICAINLTDDEIKEVNNLSTEVSIKTDISNLAFFIDVNNKYIVIQQTPDEIMNARLDGKLYFKIYRKSNKMLLSSYELKAVK